MDYKEFLTHVIEDGIRAAKKDYDDPKLHAAKLKGSLQGFEDCRGKTPEQLKTLLGRVEAEAQKAFEEQIDPPEYWEIRCRAHEVEWVCNVVSAMLWVNKQPTIIPPTVVGTLKAADILNRTN